MSMMVRAECRQHMHRSDWQVEPMQMGWETVHKLLLVVVRVVLVLY